MDNWSIQVLGWIGAFVLGVIANLATPYIRTLFSKTYLSMRERSIRYIRDEYESIKAYKANHATLAVELIRRVMIGFMYSLLLFSMVSVGIFAGLRGEPEKSLFINSPIYLSVAIGYLLTKFRSDLEVIAKVANFEKYKNETMRKLDKLGATLDDE